MAKQRLRRIRDPRARQKAVRLLPVEKQMEELWNSIIDVWDVVSPFTITITTDYTTTGKVAFEKVECNNTSAITVSLHANPRDGDVVIVTRGNTGAVTVDTAGTETINGENSIILPSQLDTPNFEWREEVAEWRIV